MKRKWMMVLTAAMGIAVISVAADLSGSKPQTDREAVQEMRTQIAELRAKVQALEGDTKRLESTVEQLKQSHDQSRTPTPLSLQVPAPSMSVPEIRSSQPPKIWGQGEVNGWTYYVVPCEEKNR